jgi:hypothetical protein
MEGTTDARYIVSVLFCLTSLNSSRQIPIDDISKIVGMHGTIPEDQLHSCLQEKQLQYYIKLKNSD